MKALLLAVFVLALVCPQSASGGKNSLSQELATFEMYKRGSGRASINCLGQPQPQACGTEDGTLIYFDCSDVKFNCAYADEHVLAVPKGGVTAGDEYSFFGARFRVGRCFTSGAACGLAKITSECEDCDLKGGRTVFYYSHEVGVTAFYVIPAQVAAQADEQLLSDAIPIITWVLVAEKGFLKMPIASDKPSFDKEH